ncbi:MAG: DUF2075 domain-containing protein [Bacteroidaceae bacterium]|nr:DUF2075 domain-containing protein [Bacteroidaceae bacterium]
MVKRYFHGDTIEGFLAMPDAQIIGILTTAHTSLHASLQGLQNDAWHEEITLLKDILTPYIGRGHIYFEYTIPRMGRRIDVVLLLDGVVLLLEFKAFNEQYTKADIAQVWDYALDLKNFHEQSHNRPIVPILVATEAVDTTSDFIPFDDKVFYPILTNRELLASTIAEALLFCDADNSEGDALWAISRYSPTPTIIEAASALYNNHSVEDISRSDASAENLTTTCGFISSVIERAKREHFKAICFVTGVPGAGKTLVGLNIATQQFEKDDVAVYLSGNFPLVQVLTEALARDKKRRMAEKGERIAIGTARSEVKTFIQMIHHYRDTCLEGTKVVDGRIVADEEYFLNPKNLKKSFVPVDHVAIFDEAQRAWTKDALANFMNRKKGYPNFPYSEPEYLISCLDRHDDWAVVVCLVGGGQEINTGEAGISEWIESLNREYKDWHVFISDRLHDAEYAAGRSLEQLSEHEHVEFEPSLHLAVSMRSFRAENLAKFVHKLLDRDIEGAREAYQTLDKYPIVLTRSLEKAKRWLKEHARGTERYGMIVSSQAERLKPLAIDVRFKPDVVHWFLDDATDVRSSFYLEDVATEFDVQGLELDWSCVVWDGDFRYTPNGWSHHSFCGDKWQNINKPERKAFQKNAYRVLLTRARQGMVLVVPEGNPEDPTRSPAYYDSTYKYLKDIGIKEI